MPPAPPVVARGKRPSAAPPVPARPKKKSVPPPMEAEPTRKLDPNSQLAQMLRAAQQAGVPPVPRKGGFDDNETQSHATRPAATRAVAQAQRPVAQRFDDESTRASDFDPRALDQAAHDVGHDTHDELIDVGYLAPGRAQADGAIDLGHRDASRPFALDDATAIADVERLAALERARTKQQRAGTFDEPTRAADAAPVKSLADVDWDID
jgi:hypothetical protein